MPPPESGSDQATVEAIFDLVWDMWKVVAGADAYDRLLRRRRAREMAHTIRNPYRRQDIIGMLNAVR